MKKKEGVVLKNNPWGMYVGVWVFQKMFRQGV
jgi:hypothetical protein